MTLKPSYYIVKNKEDDSIRFFIIGYFVDRKFSGMMHDYVGGGNYQQHLVYKDRFIPFQYLDDDDVEWDDNIDMWEKLTGLSYAKELEPFIEDHYIYYDSEQFNYNVRKESLQLFDDNVLINNCSLSIPYGLGNTSFIDGYKIEEI